MSEPLFLFPATVTVDPSEPKQFKNAGPLCNRFDVGNFTDDSSDFIGYPSLFARSAALR